MKMDDLTKLLTPEDLMMVAVKHDISYSYIKKLVTGQREVAPKVGGRPGKVNRKLVMKDLEMLACENIVWKEHKQNLIAA